MATIPYVLVLEAVLTSGGTATLSYTVPQNEQLDLNQWVFNSTGAWSITDIRDSAGFHYTNASPTTDIPSAVLPSGANNNNSLKDFVVPLHISGGKILYIDIKDLSASGNTVTLVLMGSRVTQAQ